MSHYPLTLTEDGDTLLVTCEMFPELTSFGENHDDAIRHGTDAVLEAIAARFDCGETVPAGRVMMTRGQAVAPVPFSVEAKIHLHNAMLAEGVNRAELARRLGVRSRTTVDRLLDVDHPSKIAQISEALDVLGYESAMNVQRRVAA